MITSNVVYALFWKRTNTVFPPPPPEIFVVYSKWHFATVEVSHSTCLGFLNHFTKSQTLLCIWWNF